MKDLIGSTSTEADEAFSPVNIVGIEISRRIIGTESLENNKSGAVDVVVVTKLLLDHGRQARHL